MNYLIRNKILDHLDDLTLYEQQEIQRYITDDIFFLGIGADKISPVDINNAINDFHDSSFNYRVVKGDHIIYRYEMVRILGRGSYGLVVEAYDHKHKYKVAIKIIRHGAYFHEHYLEEVERLKYLNNKFKNRNVVNYMYNWFEFRGHSCIVLELLYKDLETTLQMTYRSEWHLSKVRNIMRSLFECLSSIHDINLIHGDVKPANIVLINKDSNEVKLIDFGSSQFGSQEYMDYVQSRHYRAPEVILHLSYGPSIDIWSAGCIAFELATGEILFKGEDDDDQLTRIMEVLNLPLEEMINKSRVACKHFTDDKQPKYCTLELSNGSRKLPHGFSKSGKKRGLPGSRDFALILKNYYPAFIDFIQDCLTWDPKERMTADSALCHRWLLEKDIPIINLEPIRFMSPTAGIRNSVSSPTIFKRKFPDFYNEFIKKKRQDEQQQETKVLVSKSLSMVQCKEQLLSAYARHLLYEIQHLHKI